MQSHNASVELPVRLRITEAQFPTLLNASKEGNIQAYETYRIEARRLLELSTSILERFKLEAKLGYFSNYYVSGPFSKLPIGSNLFTGTGVRRGIEIKFNPRAFFNFVCYLNNL